MAHLGLEDLQRSRLIPGGDNTVRHLWIEKKEGASESS